MPKYLVELHRVEYCSQKILVDADSEFEAEEKVWELTSDEWSCVNAEEYVYYTKEVDHASTSPCNDNS
jgi:hypothetical protein